MVGAVVAAGLVLATPAGGALEVRLSTVPARPVALEPTRVVLRTYLPLLRSDGTCCRLEPGGPRRYPFRVVAISPSGKTFGVAVQRVRPNVWHGVFRFRAPGHWQVRVANYDHLGSVLPGARPRLNVHVSPN